MLGSECEFKCERRDKLYVDRRTGSSIESDSGTINDDDYLYSNGYHEWMYGHSDDYGDGESISKCYSEHPGSDMCRSDSKFKCERSNDLYLDRWLKWQSGNNTGIEQYHYLHSNRNNKWVYRNSSGNGNCKAKSNSNS